MFLQSEFSAERNELILIKFFLIVKKKYLWKRVGKKFNMLWNDMHQTSREMQKCLKKKKHQKIK